MIYAKSTICITFTRSKQFWQAINQLIFHATSKLPFDIKYQRLKASTFTCTSNILSNHF